MNPTDKVIQKMEVEIANLTANMAKLAERVKANPLDALSCADSNFADAAKLSVWSRIHRALSNGAKIEDVRKVANNEVRLLATHPTRSTSACANLSSQYVLQAWADSIDPVDGILA